MSTSAQSGITAEWELLCASVAPQRDAPKIHEIMERPLDWTALLARAQEHGVLPLLASTLEKARQLDGLPVACRESLAALRRAHLMFTLSLTAEFFRLSDSFKAAGLNVIAVKGPVLATLAFGDPGLRQYSDVDLLVRHCDVLGAARVMEDCGFVSELPLEAAAQRIPGQFLFVREQTRAIVELHTERTLRYFPQPIPVEAFFARQVSISLDGRTVPALCPEDTLVFICVHGSKHFWERLLWIADVAGLLARQTAFDWARAFDVARKTGTERMVRLGLCLAMEMLCAPVPSHVADEVRSDVTALQLSGEIRRHLASGEAAQGAFHRAMMRMQMCGGFLRSARYLLRLLLTPTEEDWGGSRPGSLSGWLDAMRRPLRLARKYRADSGSPEKRNPLPENAESKPATKRKKARA
jgi:hypothetical protein